MKTYVDGNGGFEEIAEMFKIRKNIDTVIREKNIKNQILDYIEYKELNWYGHVRRMNEE